MDSAGGLLSTVNDLTKYCKSLMHCWPAQTQVPGICNGVEKKTSVLDDMSWLFAPLQIMDRPAFREKSYAAGWIRSQLPTTVGDLGVNPGLMEEMPLLAQGIESRLALWHQGSLVGATCFVMMLPETESAVLVLTNTMCPNDAADWIGQLLVETLLNSPVRHDFVNLAAVSRDRAFARFAELTRQVQRGLDPGGPRRSLSGYVGSYVSFGGVFRIDVTESSSGLAILFQGRESQKYQLRHHHGDTFTWFISWNEQMKRARYLEYNPVFYSICFKTEEGSPVWPGLMIQRFETGLNL